jgi:hypothetical protein
VRIKPALHDTFVTLAPQRATNGTSFGPFVAGFIGGSSPDATVEGARRPLSRWPFPMVAGFLLGASSTGKLATSFSPVAGREQAPLGDALQLAGA